MHRTSFGVNIFGVAGTPAIQIGSNIAYGVGWSPLIWVAEARGLDELSGGRIILGLGNGGLQTRTRPAALLAAATPFA